MKKEFEAGGKNQASPLSCLIYKGPGRPHLHSALHFPPRFTSPWLIFHLSTEKRKTNFTSLQYELTVMKRKGRGWSLSSTSEHAHRLPDAEKVSELSSINQDVRLG